MPDAMRARSPDFVLPVALAAALTLALAALGLQETAWTDYEAEAKPAVDRLRAGDLGGFLDALPAYGGSLLLRAPFAVAPNLWDGGGLAAFRLLSLPCLVAAAALGLLLWRRVEAAGGTRAVAVGALVLCAANPLTLMALEFGHPEELLGGVLCVGAVLAAGARRPLVAGALLGLAIANKPWAVLAVAPVVIVSGGLACECWPPRRRAPASSSPNAAGRQRHRLAGGGGRGRLRSDLQAVAGLVVPRRARRPGRGRADGLLLLALVLLLRCILDPWNIGYYELPFLLALIAWEVHARAGPPFVALTATLLCYLTLQGTSSIVSLDLQAAGFLAWSVPFAAAMLVRLAAPSWVEGRAVVSPAPLAAGGVASRA